MSKTPFSVLLLDDDFHTRELFELVFAHHELELISVTTTGAALAHLRKHTPDVVVIDLVMPEIDGFTALAEMRKVAANPATPFVATTAYYSSDTAEKVYAHGFHGYLPKPFSVEELVPKLRSFAQG